jgi:UDP-N-acetylglucosamine--N-acetylmuramyl-(pentapeptide) pyrophosphoryl-undecaprenol N-acetylglucosamine transferase
MTSPEQSDADYLAPLRRELEQGETSRLFVFAGGGTGGHIAPGIALANELRRRDPACRIHFAGSGRPIEQRMIGPTGYVLTAHDAPPLTQLKRRPLHFLKSHWKAIRDTRREFQSDQPAAVIGLGGFASVPIVLAARREGIPVLLLEQNVIPGRANWWLSRHHPICVTFAETRHHLPKQATCHVTGNPLREEILALFRSPTPLPPGATAGSPSIATEPAPTTAGQAGSATQPKTLLILGGSNGSRQINDSALNAIRNLREQLADWHIIHQSGPDGCEEARRVYSDCSLSATVEPFFDNLPQLYAQTTLAISRAGATTLTEFAAAAIPSILIPYPHAAADHQTCNARAFSDAGAAILINNPTRSPAPLDLIPALQPLLEDSKRLKTMATATRTLAHPEATRAVTDLVTSIIS